MEYNRLNDIKKPLITWYQKEKRELPWRLDTNPYHVWLSEIMLQQTRVEAVKEYYTRFLKELPDIKSLSLVEEDKLLKLWQGLGYYNRAKNLQKAARIIVEKHQGKFPATYEEILALPGIGVYTAGAIGSICFSLPTPAVDGNVLRVVSRVCESYENIDLPATKKKIDMLLGQVYKEQCLKEHSTGTLTQALMELGAIVCIPNGAPKCEACPLQHICLACENGTTNALPVKEKKRARKKQEMTVFILHCKDKIAVRKRDEKGLLSGLWEFPNVIEALNEQDAVNRVTQWQCKPKAIEKLIRYQHIFTHVEWHMTGYYMECANEMDEFVWVTKEEMENNIPLPSAFMPFWDAFC